MSKPVGVPLSQFGRDHWSAFAYVAGCVTLNGGQVDYRKMRADRSRHPQFAHLPGSSPPTRLRDGFLPEHDDWDCVEDLVAAGLLLWRGTGLSPVFGLTEQGWDAFKALVEHRGAGNGFPEGSFGTFEWAAPEPPSTGSGSPSGVASLLAPFSRPLGASTKRRRT